MHLKRVAQNLGSVGLRPDYQRPLSFFADEEDGDAVACQEKAKACAEAGQPDEAIACLDKALAANPELAQSWFGKGEVLFNRGRRDEAHACFEKALELDPQCAAEWVKRVLRG